MQHILPVINVVASSCMSSHIRDSGALGKFPTLLIFVRDVQVVCSPTVFHQVTPGKMPFGPRGHMDISIQTMGNPEPVLERQPRDSFEGEAAGVTAG